MHEKMRKEPCERLVTQGKNDEPEFSDLDTGWAWVVLFTSFGTFCLMGATQFASGIVHMILLERYQANESLTSLVGALHTSLIFIAAPVAGVVLDRFSCRVAIVSSGICFVIGSLGSAFAQNIWIVILTRGVVAGIGGALGLMASMIVVGFYFRKRRNLAIGLSNAGIGVGLCVFAPLMQKIYDHYGSVGFFIIIAGIFAQIILFGMLSFPSKLERYAKLQRSRKCFESTDNHTLSNGHQSYLDVLTNKSVFCLSVGMFLLCFGTYGLYLHLPNYIVSNGFTQMEAANLISLSGVLTSIGRVTTGVIANCGNIREDVLYCLPILVLSVFTFVYPYTSSYFAGNVIFIVFLGLLYGNCYVLTTSMTVKYVGIANVSKAIGIQYFSGGVGALIGPVLYGFLVDAGGTYKQVFLIAGFCILMSSVSSGTASCFTPDVGANELTVNMEKEVESPFNKKIDNCAQSD
ncbi:monocarboxylate transporter 4-like [Mercenaria mercenaria]|uniref:monocarboxylate transporter 4-like n=1 Tax=Mercenaria mercenaria TaxID=6596 RepID=UPI001E1DBB69|nr:monocarboxylate transporter 4-like [Mercenaria mercenaria]XP_045188746.1 monocarboxylate transporter 4-like [Mercenaria mercenaria]